MSVEVGAPLGGRDAREAAVVMVMDGELVDVPMRNWVESAGLTVSVVDLVDGVVNRFEGRWRGRFGQARSCIGDVVVELVAPTQKIGEDHSRVKVGVRVLVASARGWLWVGDAPGLGRDWPRVIAPLVWIEHHRRARVLHVPHQRGRRGPTRVRADRPPAARSVSEFGRRVVAVPGGCPGRVEGH